MEISRAEDLIYTKPDSKNGEEYPYSSSAKVFLTKQLFLYSEKVEPGRKASSPHYHRAIDEIIFVIEGVLIACEGDKEVVLKKGDAVCFNANSGDKHYLENRSKSDAIFLIFRRATINSDVVY